MGCSWQAQRSKAVEDKSREPACTHILCLDIECDYKIPSIELVCLANAQPVGAELQVLTDKVYC